MSLDKNALQSKCLLCPINIHVSGAKLKESDNGFYFEDQDGTKYSYTDDTCECGGFLVKVLAVPKKHRRKGNGGGR